jgi:hypothetical protein
MNKTTKKAFSVSLTIYVEGSSEKPRTITTVEQFMRPFDDSRLAILGK